jgi:hypothetical protein
LRCLWRQRARQCCCLHWLLLRQCECNV